MTCRRFEEEALLARLEKAFEGWEKGETMANPPAPTMEVTPAVYHVEKDIPQGKVYIGMRGVRRELVV